MIRKLVAAAVLGILVTASGAMAQEGRWQGISVQGTGLVTSRSSCSRSFLLRSSSVARRNTAKFNASSNASAN
jgi:hypothetical protein